MFKILLSLIGFWSFAAFAIPCDCEVRVFSPLTGSHSMSPLVIKTFDLEDFRSYAPRNIIQCRSSCLAEFHKEMPSSKLNALLVVHSMQLIDQKVLGFNCNGLTNLKYPVRVKARLAENGLGNVADIVQVVSHEEVCF